MTDAVKIAILIVLWVLGIWFLKSIAPVPDPWAFIIAVLWFYGPIWLVSQVGKSSPSSTGSKHSISGYSQYPEDWNEIRAQVLMRDGYQCGNCGQKTILDIHHIVPLSRGGSNRISNLRTLCRDCHTLLHPHMRQ